MPVSVTSWFFGGIGMGLISLVSVGLAVCFGLACLVAFVSEMGGVLEVVSDVFAVVVWGVAFFGVDVVWAFTANDRLVNKMRVSEIFFMIVVLYSPDFCL